MSHFPTRLRGIEAAEFWKDLERNPGKTAAVPASVRSSSRGQQVPGGPEAHVFATRLTSSRNLELSARPVVSLCTLASERAAYCETSKSLLRCRFPLSSLPASVGGAPVRARVCGGPSVFGCWPPEFGLRCAWSGKKSLNCFLARHFYSGLQWEY